MKAAIPLLALLLAGCAADGGIVTKNKIVEGYKYLVDEDETQKLACCDEDFRILSPVSVWYRPNKQPESVELGWVWEQQHPDRVSMDVRLVTADGYRRLKRIELEINGKKHRITPERRLTHWEGNDFFRGPCLPPACVRDTFLFRSGRLFPVHTDLIREAAASDRVRVIVYDETNKPIYGYLPAREDSGQQRRHLIYWLRSVESQINREADLASEFQ